MILPFSELPSVYDHTGKTAYTEGCKKLGVVPASYFLQHMHDRKLSLKHHGLGATGMKAVAVSLVVSKASVTVSVDLVLSS